LCDVLPGCCDLWVGAEDCLKVKQQKLAVYGNGESNYYYQLQRFINDLKVLEDGEASKQ